MTDAELNKIDPVAVRVQIKVPCDRSGPPIIVTGKGACVFCDGNGLHTASVTLAQLDDLLTRQRGLCQFCHRPTAGVHVCPGKGANG